MLEAAGQDHHTSVTRSGRGLLAQDGTYLEPMDAPEDIINSQCPQAGAISAQCNGWPISLEHAHRHDTTRYPGFGIGKKVPLLGLDQIKSHPPGTFDAVGRFGVPRGATKIPCFGRRDDGDGRMHFLANQTPFYVSKKLLSNESIESNKSNCAPGELSILVAHSRRV